MHTYDRTKDPDRTGPTYLDPGRVLAGLRTNNPTS